MTKIREKLTAGDNQYFFKMFRFMRPYAVRYAITQFIYSAQGFAMPFALSIFAGSVLAAIVAGDADAIRLAGITLSIMLGGFLLALLVAVYINLVVIERATMDMKQKLFRVFIRTGLEDASHSGEGIAAINTDANTAANVFDNQLMMLLNGIITAIGATVVVFVADWRLGFATLAVGILSFFMQHRFTEPLAKIGKERLEVNAEALKATSNIFSGAMTIRAYNMQSQAFLTFDRESSRLRTLDIRQGLIRMGQSLFATVRGWLTLVVVFGFGGWLAATGRIEFHVIASVYIMAASLTSAISSLGQNYANLQPPIAAAKRVFSILEKGEIEGKTGGVERTANGYDISVRDFSFRYSDAPTDVLKNINLEVRENETIALVGESGSGKSTLLRAIVGMYERTDIDIRVGDLSFGESSLKNWRNHFAYVEQNCRLFDMSIFENISMGALGASREDVVAAAKRAMAHEFIEQLELGYDTPCGEQGGVLSGGQKQRIAIARALVKKAPVLLFDEPTSALDKESERQIMETIRSLASDHTVLFTTHSLGNAELADRVVVMRDGEISEER